MTRQNNQQRFSSTSSPAPMPDGVTSSPSAGGFTSHTNPVTVPRPRSQQAVVTAPTTKNVEEQQQQQQPKTATTPYIGRRSPVPTTPVATKAPRMPATTTSSVVAPRHQELPAIMTNKPHQQQQQQQHVVALPQHPVVSRNITNCLPYGHLACPTNQMVPHSLGSKMGGNSSSHSSSSNPMHAMVAKECLFNAGITFHFWEEIEEQNHYESEVLGRPSRLQPMEALEELRRTEAKINGVTLQQQKDNCPLFGLHMGQFLRHEARIANFETLNFLTIQLLADISDVTLYKCDFDKTSCCRVFLDGPQSYERVLYWNKRLRSTPQGVFVAHDDYAASLLEDVNLDKIAPYHTIPITPLKTSYEQTARQRGTHSVTPGRFANSATPTATSTTYGGSFATPPVMPQMVTPSLGACTPPPQEAASLKAFRSAAKELELPTVLDLGASCADSNGNTPTPAPTLPSSTTASGAPGLLHDNDSTIIPTSHHRLTPNSKQPEEQEDDLSVMMSGSGYASDQETPMKVTRSTCSMGAH